MLRPVLTTNTTLNATCVSGKCTALPTLVNVTTLATKGADSLCDFDWLYPAPVNYDANGSWVDTVEALRVAGCLRPWYGAQSAYRPTAAPGKPEGSGAESAEAGPSCAVNATSMAAGDDLALDLAITNTGPRTIRAPWQLNVTGLAVVDTFGLQLKTKQGTSLLTASAYYDVLWPGHPVQKLLLVQGNVSALAVQLAGTPCTVTLMAA